MTNNDMNKDHNATLAGRTSSDEARREAARIMGSARTPKKLEAARRNAPINGKKGGRPRKLLSEIPCSCPAGDALEGHRWNCLRGQAIKRRTSSTTSHESVEDGRTE